MSSLAPLLPLHGSVSPVVRGTRQEDWGTGEGADWEEVEKGVDAES